MADTPDDPTLTYLDRLMARMDARLDPKDGKPAESDRSEELLRMVLKGDEILHRHAVAGIERRLEKIESRLAALEKRDL